MLSKLRSFFGKHSSDSPAAPTNWALLIQSEDIEPNGFIEIRQNACVVWSARGEPFTAGHKELTEFRSPSEAKAFFNQTISNYEAKGFTLLHSGQATPGHLDCKLLEDSLYRGARQAYQRICEENSEEIIVGFALFTDFDGMTICPAAMAETTFCDLVDDADYYRTNPSEWPFTTDSGLLLAYRIILVSAYESRDIPFEKEIDNYFDQFFECCVRALERLDSEGLFGRGTRRADFLLLFGVSDGGPTKATVARLNPVAVYQRYEHCFDE